MSIDLTPETQARLRQLATQRGTTPEALIEGFVRAAAEDLLHIALPTGPGFWMAAQEGRDAIAAIAAQGGWAAYETPLPAVLRGWLQAVPGGFVDVGANTGFYSLLLATIFPAIQVLAYEPDPAAHALCAANLALNGLQGRLAPFPLAASDTAGPATLWIPPQTHGLIETSCSLEASFKHKHAEAIGIAAVPLDSHLPPHLSGPVSAIKLDIAGHEARALAGAEELVGRHRPLLILEVLGITATAPLTDFILRHGYVDVPLRTNAELTAHGIVVADAKAWNHALVPAEALPRLLAAHRMGG